MKKEIAEAINTIRDYCKNHGCDECAFSYIGDEGLTCGFDGSKDPRSWVAPKAAMTIGEAMEEIERLKAEVDIHDDAISGDLSEALGIALAIMDTYIGEDTGEEMEDTDGQEENN